jgi:putative membrane protein
MENRNQTFYLPLYLAVVFHVSGYFGMQSSFRDWFVAATPLTLLLMAVMIVLTLKQRTRQFWQFVALCFVTGVSVEWVGVNTGLLFGQYAYGHAMGPKFGGVPLMIGIQWFVTVWSIGHLTYWILSNLGMNPDQSLGKKVLAVIIGAFLTTCFDFALEPAAISLGYWQWFPDNQIPFLNYACWFIVSGLLLIPFVLSPHARGKTHPFAIALAIIQLVFFIFVR